MGILDSIFNRSRSERAAAAAAAEANYDEKRRSPRYRVMQRSSIYATRRPMSAVIVDVSREGARIATRMPRDIGAVIGVELEVEGRAMCLPLRLQWDRLVDGGFEAGGAFVQLNEEESGHLDRYLSCVQGKSLEEPIELGELLAPTP